MPFSGVVPIQSNSKPAGDDDQLREFGKHAVKVAQFLNATAPIRIDCREGADGVIKAIDINMKPSMTGPGRPGREQMINLSAMSAGEIGWSYTEMLAAIAGNGIYFVGFVINLLYARLFKRCIVRYARRYVNLFCIRCIQHCKQKTHQQYSCSGNYAQFILIHTISLCFKNYFFYGAYSHWSYFLQEGQ